MPKRSTKRPVGRPKKSKVKRVKEGQVFASKYGVIHFLENQPLAYFDEEVAQRFMDVITSLCNSITGSSENEITKEFQECQLQIEFLRKWTVHFLEWLNLEDEEKKHLLDPSEDKLVMMRLIAIAFTAGQLSVIAPHREHENSYSTGKKMVASAYQGGQRRRLKRPAKSELCSALKKEIAKHGKRTMAVSNVAKHHGVSANTVRTWMKELSITLK